ncbi:Pre-mRNA-splicing factor of RES complex-domain-containing protein [Fomitopsis serialis]|uniref:Pre-mRNA-splicing factor of RES complex-domain-containing protein n=1 Tax=Fomitopsis serialis TaxID=139415 RepID=UPI0020082B45|nr:Pre-mRNA-splicing factor of RES complex-domain-containing protein [Neoantrodia serialis]KAH9938230.1 Pre-mRNA-splicing factor of RES complex-domain-containing protein [Neoantrodia serialis]
MQAYLAAKYMSGPKADAILSRTSAPKKKKRKAGTAASSKAGSSGASFIKDHDVLGWDSYREADEDEVADAVVAEDRGFKKRQRMDEASGWATVREGEQREESPPPAADEQPQVVEEQPAFKGGLLTAAQLKKTLPREKGGKTAKEKELEEQAAAQETVYRDSSGRQVDMAAERAEAARRKREREEQEARKMEWGKGLVQREDVEKRRKEEEAMRARPFARDKNDADMNEELKAQDRWNDPAAAFLTKKRSKGPRKPEYSGPPPPPNRYGIKPGYRWDGVDRGNGFEKKLFQRQNDKRRRGLESYQWSVDDM